MTQVLRRAAFLDRDGTLIDDPGYLGDPAGVVLLPGVAEAIARLRAAGFVTVVVSNQSGVARGLFAPAAVHAVNQRMAELLLAAHPQAHLDAIYFCPHGPTDGCLCRKPLPGLFQHAAQELALALPDSICFGDSERDLVAGTAAGCRQAARVGAAAPSLLTAVLTLLEREKRPC
jgi:D-glycero-D-manno-heptose 1,7-bisphosphate phosphatase